MIYEVVRVVESLANVSVLLLLAYLAGSSMRWMAIHHDEIVRLRKRSHKLATHVTTLLAEKGMRPVVFEDDGDEESAA